MTSHLFSRFAAPLAFLFGSLLLSLSGCDDDPDPSQPQAPAAAGVTTQALAGRWASTSCEAYPDGKGGSSYLKRDFSLTSTTWSLDLAVFGDQACSVPLFSARIDGPYSLGKASSVVPGATEGEFTAKTNVWTAHAQAMADTFNQAGCGAGGWKVGEPQDVAQTGCIGVAHKASECPAEHDIVAIDGSSLYFGERITNLCSEDGRPKAKSSYAVVKK